MTQTSPVPLPVPLAMSTAPPTTATSTAAAAATPSPIPIRQQEPLQDASKASTTSTRPALPRHPYPTPKLRFEARDLRHPGTKLFFQTTDPSEVLSQATQTVLQHLYTDPPSDIPPIRSITLILRPMEGVAYTTSNDLDNDHKEIHLSTTYITSVASTTPLRIKEEILGVITHELTHVWQWNGHGRAPGGLIEGVADFIRLRAGLGPPHWEHDRDPKARGKHWDEGYQHTAFFLEWLDTWKKGPGAVREMNRFLGEKAYREEEFWNRLCGKSVGDLWNEYCDTYNQTS